MELKKLIAQKIKELQPDMIEASKKFVSINSVNPRTGGPGEKEVSEYLQAVLQSWKFDEIKRYDAPDSAVPYGYRPNIIAIYKGKNPSKTLWFMTHMDKVPAGDISLWNTDPYTAVEKDGKIYGRGSEDNGSSMISSIFAVKALMDMGIRPENNIGIALVSDEETGSEYGIQYLIDQKVFGKNDWFVIPDSGEPDGAFIELAEKSMMRFKITTQGKQAHASMPNLAKNAVRAGMNFAVAVDKFLNETYNVTDPLFDPPYSTFEPTKKDNNVENINTIPGTDVQHFDCRVLPMYDVNDIMAKVKDMAREYSRKYDVTITIDDSDKRNAPAPTPEDHDLVKLLKASIKEMTGIIPRTGGIGGGTCAAHLRAYGIPCVVWATLDEMAHQPNEYIKIEYLLKDACVYAYMMSKF